MLFFLLFLGYFFYGLQPVMAREGGKEGSVEVVITKGESFKDIGSRLSQDELIKSISVFKIYSFIVGKAHMFQPGVYTLSGTMSVPQIVDILTEGGKNDVTVTIPEGYTVKDIDATLISSGVLKNKTLSSLNVSRVLSQYPEFQNLSSFEGLLFPDTYRLKRDSSPEEVAKIFLDTFVAKAWPLLKEDNHWYEILTLASFLEREVPNFEDRRMVAGILLKRYARDMPLQVDATITYVMCEEAFRGCKERVRKRDTVIPSAYNTYQKLGWTPTPIANPGQSAIQAAESPLKSPYVYYLSRNTGETIFSKTLEEHNNNRAKYL